MSPYKLPDPAACPLCGQANHCAVQLAHTSGIPQPPCWCTRASFSDEWLAKIPADARGRACICAACATASHSPAS